MKNFKIEFIETPEMFTEKELREIKGGREGDCSCKCWINGGYCNCKGNASYTACPCLCKE